ncbi:hypothetical protein OROHE_001983 [Orobanche hederae]
MKNSIVGRTHRCLRYGGLRIFCSSSTISSIIHGVLIPTIPEPGLCRMLDTFRTFSLKTSSTCSSSATVLRHLHGGSSTTERTCQESVDDDSNSEVEPIDSWEEEDEAEAEVGDGGDGGGVVLKNCPWGERALSIAQEVLKEFGEDMELYAFKTSHRGYIYVRLDKLSNEYGCPGMEEIESFSRRYKKKLDEFGAVGEIPEDLALEVSSPGAERLLRVPDDLLRFKDLPMVVNYSEESDAKCPEKNGVYFLDSVGTESRCCIWKLADVRENRDPSAKGRPLSRKQKDSRLKLSYDTIKRVTLYISY